MQLKFFVLFLDNILCTKSPWWYLWNINENFVRKFFMHTWKVKHHRCVLAQYRGHKKIFWRLFFLSTNAKLANFENNSKKVSNLQKKNVLSCMDFVPEVNVIFNFFPTQNQTNSRQFYEKRFVFYKSWVLDKFCRYSLSFYYIYLEKQILSHSELADVIPE